MIDFLEFMEDDPKGWIQRGARKVVKATQWWPEVMDKPLWLSYTTASHAPERVDPIREDLKSRFKEWSRANCQGRTIIWFEYGYVMFENTSDAMLYQLARDGLFPEYYDA